MGTTAERFLSPALEKIATTLGMSESLAGVTLLAMGNGAPDVLTSVSAAGSEHTGMFFSVGSLSGSGLFVTGVVTALVILFSKKNIKVPGLSMVRDICFYLTALTTVLIASIVGELNIFFACTFFFIYFSYVVVVVIMDKIEQKALKAKKKEGREEAKISKVGSINPDEEVLVDEDSEKSDDEDYFDCNKAVPHDVGNQKNHFENNGIENKKALTQDTSSNPEESDEEWSMVIEEPMIPKDKVTSTINHNTKLGMSS